MYSRRWRTSPREYRVVQDLDVRVPMSDGTLLVGSIFRPAAEGRFPVILGCHPYNNELQVAPLTPVAFDSGQRGYLESGDPSFYVRRGYVHAIFNVRGTGKSQGFFQLMGPQEAQDVAELIAWLASQPWSSGKVGMFGVSYFAMLAKKVASLNPPALAAIFAPFGVADLYREFLYHGGILGHGFLTFWRHNWDNPRVRSAYLEEHGEAAYREAIQRALLDEEIMAVAALAEVLRNPERGTNPLLADVILHYLDEPFYQSRNGKDDQAEVPAYLGACWGVYGLHLPGAFSSWKLWKGPKKLVVGPPLYLDRPLYQYQYESLRWFDHWLKGIDTGIMSEPPVRCFMSPIGEWRMLDDWPPEEAHWTPFYLHAGGLLSEHELWPDEGSDTFEDSTYRHGSLTYVTPPLVENTELLGPSILTLHLSTTDTDALLFATLLLIDRDGQELELTRGWLRASQRRLREDSEPWAPTPAHQQREPLTPRSIYELRFEIVPTGRLCLAGERVGLRIKAADDEPARGFMQQIARNHLWRQTPARITIYHDEDHPSRIDLPVTRGNVVGTFFSGGIPIVSGPQPQAKIDMPKEVQSSER